MASGIRRVLTISHLIHARRWWRSYFRDRCRKNCRSKIQTYRLFPEPGARARFRRARDPHAIQVRNLEAVRDVFGSQFQDDGFTDLEIDTIGLVGKLMRSSFITRS